SGVTLKISPVELSYVTTIVSRILLFSPQHRTVRHLAQPREVSPRSCGQTSDVRSSRTVLKLRRSGLKHGQDLACSLRGLRVTENLIILQIGSKTIDRILKIPTIGRMPLPGIKPFTGPIG